VIKANKYFPRLPYDIFEVYEYEKKMNLSVGKTELKISNNPNGGVEMLGVCTKK
jgi:hypothetical protein